MRSGSNRTRVPWYCVRVDKDLSASPARLSIGEAILAAIQAAGISQAAVAREIGVTPPTVTRWVQNENLPTVYDLAQIENFIRREVPNSSIVPGDILRAAGLVEDHSGDDCSIEASIARDLRLTDSAKSAMLGALDGALRASFNERERRH